MRNLEVIRSKVTFGQRVYVQPTEFTARCNMLSDVIRNCLHENESTLGMFKDINAEFMNGNLDPKEFYSLCLDIFDVDDFKRVLFPELIALLPDICKQQVFTDDSFFI